MLEITIAIVILLFLSAFFSGSETALTAASEPLLHQLETKGDARASVVNRLRARRSNMIGSILIGNNLVNILASALATSVMIGIFGKGGIVYATIGMTALVVIFAEILPKTYAIHNADRVALAIAPAIRIVVTVLLPLTRATQGIVRGVLFVLGTGLHRDETFGSSADALRGAIALHEGDEDTVEHERAMLRSVLDLAEVEVGEIMIHRKDVDTIDLSDPPAAVIDHALESPYTRLPVWQGEPDNVVGVLHAKALLRSIGRADTTLNHGDLEALMTEPWFIPETTTLLDQLHAFRDRAEHFALVIDEYGSLMGVVTLEDILEEIVGEISDEHDRRVVGVKRQPDGTYLVSGTVTIRDLNRQLGWDLPDEEAATIAGLVLHESRRIPEVGQTFIYYGFRFEIVRRQRNQIATLRISPPRDTGEGVPSASE